MSSTTKTAKRLSVPAARCGWVWVMFSGTFTASCNLSLSHSHCFPFSDLYLLIYFFNKIQISYAVGVELGLAVREGAIPLRQQLAQQEELCLIFCHSTRRADSPACVSGTDVVD